LTAADCQGIKDYDFGLINLKGLATVPFSQLLRSFFAVSVGGDADIADWQCFNLLSKFGLTTKWAKHHLVKKILDNKIMSVYNKRYAEGVFDAGKQEDSGNIIDLMVHHNKRCLADGRSQELLTDYDIIGDIMFFMFAGIINSSTISTSSILHCTKSYPEWIDKIKAAEVGSIDAIMNNKSLDLVMRESTRVWTPLFSSFRRLTIKPMEICGITIPKGHYVMAPYGWNRDKPCFVDATKFRPERFEEEIPKLQKEQRASFMPYYEGKRKCVGYVLGEMSIKLVVGNMLKMFEFENRLDGEIRMVINVAYEAADPKIGIKLK
jgi:cytochrome P450